VLDAGFAADLRAVASRRASDGLAHRARAALLGAPGGERAVELSHEVVQQHVGGARRLDAEHGADDPAQAHHGADDVRLDPLRDEVVSAHRHELRELLEGLLVEALQVSSEFGERAGASQAGARGIRRHVIEDRLHGTHDAVHHPDVLRNHLGVALRVAPNLLAQGSRVGIHRELVAVLHRHPDAVERHDLQAVLRELELADHLRTQEAHHVGEDRELEAGKDLLADRCAAHEVALLQHQRATSRFCEIGGARQPVVTTTNDDCIIRACHRNSTR